MSLAAVLGEKVTPSVLGSMSVLNPDSQREKKSIVADLLLTALIDAFSILVIFLLMSFSSTGEILYIGKGVELPKASQTSVLDRNPVVKMEQDQMYLEDTIVTADSLTAALLDLRKKFKDEHPDQDYPGVLTVQADRRIAYASISQIVAAASQAGFSDLKFATVAR
jgi:biopolymer transport protein ExbD